MAGLVPFGVVYLIQRVYYAFEDARTPFRLQVIISVVATVAGLLALLLPDPWVGFGIGAGQTLSNLVGAVVGVVWVRRRLEDCRSARITRSYVRLTVASLAGAVPAALLTWALTRVVAGRLRGPRGPAGRRQRVRSHLPRPRPPAAGPRGRRAARTAARARAPHPARALSAI